MADATRATASGDPPEESLIAGRYRVEERLGKGGMGAVYRVFDQSTGQMLALKQLLDAENAKPEAISLFQREYYSLVQLAHPLIIKVCDYGVDAHGPYYTMELLGGSDLRQMAPMEWKRACGLLRDVASSLAILHSRRLLHRDVTPRNVRCGTDGRAKLMDFGAMMPMGESKRVVGTPPYVPPEAVNRQPMDGRADLFSLGALAYWLLTGRHAYPARRVAQLTDAWRSKPLAPNSLVSDIPPALNSLVLSLLSLDRLGRPVDAAEVIDRLSAIGDLPKAEPLGVSQAYLTTPVLVGRDDELTEFRKRALRGVTGKGSTVVIEGTSGSGRSRLLMSCMLEAKIVGAGVVSAGAEDGRSGEYGVVRALVDDLLETAPRETLEAAKEYGHVLGHVLPEVHERLGRPELATSEDPSQLRPRVQTALLEFFVALSTRRYLAVAVDDLHRCDEPSAALLASLSRSAPRLRLVLAATLEKGAVPVATEAVRMLRRTGVSLKVQPLQPDENQTLLRSVFGNAPNLKPVAEWVHGLSQGNPRTCMELAQHLLNLGIAHYEAGNWTLPDSLPRDALPKSLEQALGARVAALSRPARDLAEALSMASEWAPLELKDYALLMSTGDVREVFAALDELVGAQVLVSRGDRYVFSQRGLIQALLSGLDQERRREIHGRLALAYESGGYEKPLVVIDHLQQGGEGERALGLLLPLLEENRIADEAYALQVQCCEAALRLASSLGRSPRDLYWIRKRLLRMANRYDASLVRHADQVEEQLRADSGLVFWDQLEETIEPSQRIRRCLEMAEDGWQRTPASERGLHAVEAVQELAVYAAFMASVVAPALDAEHLARLARMMDPLRPLSPGADLLYRILTTAGDDIGGLPVRERWREIEELLKQPVSGVDEVTRARTQNIISYYLALNDLAKSSVGVAGEVSGRARSLERNPSFATHAWRIRMLAAICDGKAEEAHACREQVELLALQNPESDTTLSTGLAFEAYGYFACGDLMGLKRVLVPVAKQAERYATFMPLQQCLRGQYHLLRGELQQARAELERGLAAVPAGGHPAWRVGIAPLTQTMLQQGEPEAARTLALRALEAAETRNVEPASLRDLKMVLAVVEAKLGRHSQAVERLDAVIEQARNAGTARVLLGNLYEARARIALEARDEPKFIEYGRLTASQYRSGRHPALEAKYRALLEDARHDNFGGVTDLEDTLDTGGVPSDADELVIPLSKVRSIMGSCKGSRQRADTALKLLLQQTGAEQGYLYKYGQTTLTLIAQAAVEPPPPGLEPIIKEYLAELGDDDEGETSATDTLQSELTAQGAELVTDRGQRFCPVILRGQKQGQSIITAVAVLAETEGSARQVPWGLVVGLGEAL